MWVKGHPLFLLKTNGRSPPRAASSQTQIINSICIIRCIIRLWDQETCPFLSFFSIYLFTPSFGAGVGARRVVTSRVSVHVQALLTEGHLGAAGGSALTCICTQVPGSFFKRIKHAYPERQRSCGGQWSRRRLRSTCLSSGCPYESLCRSHNWRWSGCSPDRPSERVRPGQPWLPVGHKTVRITSPSKEQLLLVLSTHAAPPACLLAGAACFGSSSAALSLFFLFIYLLFSAHSTPDETAFRKTKTEAPVVANRH